MANFGRYEVIEELGRGGMAQVFHARDPQFDREVAVKALPREFLHDPQFRARFQREARALAALQHKSIVPVHDIGEEGGQPYLVMGYMSGGSVADRLEQGPLSLDETYQIIADIAPALDYAHQRGMIHRDLKPGNILFDSFGDAFLSDFGIVRLSEATAQLTGTGILGTPAYMAPEMAQDAEPTHLVDIYALGVTIYRMLAGRLPYEATTPMGLIAAHITRPVPDILSVNADLPPAIQTVIYLTMAKEPTERYPVAEAVSAALRDVLEGNQPVTPTDETLPIDRPYEPTLIETADHTGPASPVEAVDSIQETHLEQAEEYPKIVRSSESILDVLPEPFEWCEIPAGQVTIGEGMGHFEVKPFYMAKYQTTYEQFQIFIDAGDGYYNKEWWHGLAKRETEPGSQHFTYQSDLPCDNVSWFDALAFCRWLSSKVGYEVRLPTEWEWQWAAQGSDGRAYPWGNDYIQDYANIDEKNSNIDDGEYLKETTPVGSYPEGASPFGVLDMCGNVWEWCMNQDDEPDKVHTTGDAYRVLRGGSWSNDVLSARVDVRYGYDPRYRDWDCGFRVVGFVPILK